MNKKKILKVLAIMGVTLLVLLLIHVMGGNLISMVKEHLGRAAS